MKAIITSGSNSMSTRLRRPLGPAAFTFLAALGLALTLPARAETQPAPIPFTDIGARATADYHGDALGVTATADGVRLSCGFQKLQAHSTPEGLWLESTGPGAAGKLRLTATTIGRAGLSTANNALLGEAKSRPVGKLSTTLPATGTVSVQDKLVRFTRPGLTEEYSVSVDGVRQDFVIAAPPAGAGELRVELTLRGARAEPAAYGARLTLEGSGRALAYSRLRALDATGRELTAHLEVLSADRLAVSVGDNNATYPVRIDPTFSDTDWVSLNPGMLGADNGVRAIAADNNGNIYVGGDFTFIGTVQANRIAKWDGSGWSALGSGLTGGSYPEVFALAVSGTNLYAGGTFSSAGGIPANYIAKWDGSAWSGLGSGMNSGGYVWALAVSGTDLYAGGWFGTAGGVPAIGVAKWDGSAWSALGSGINGRVSALAVSGTSLYLCGNFTTAGGLPANGIAKWDGGWSALGSGMGPPYANPYVSALAVIGTDLYAGGSFATAGGVWASNIAKWNGSAWSALGSGMAGYNLGVNALAVSGNHLYAGGNFTTAGGVTANSIAKWDGSTWSALSSGVNGGISALAVSGTSLYAGGGFSTAGGVPAINIAKWDGSTWSGLGVGFGDMGHFHPPGDCALAVSGTDLYAGGTFTAAGGVPANFIAKWNGTAWSALASGMSGPVSALVVNGTDLYAGGWWLGTGGVTANGIAKWNGSAWSALGAGMGGGGYGGDVYALAVGGANLYAGGSFIRAGGLPANYIAKWDGSTWSALGSGMNSYVYALAVSGTDLYAGGAFTTAGGLPANYIAKWNGSAWSALGSGMNGTVYALAVSGTDLYAGGNFTTAGGLPANYITKWNGSAWSALGLGVNTNVQALAVNGGDLYAGGNFTSAGGVPANYIAKWDGSAWSALGSGMTGGPSPYVYALAADGAGHLFVGGDFYLAGTNVSPYIAQANLGNSPTSAAPVILASPASLTVPIGATADFQVEAFGSPLLVYQWFFDGTTAIDGATSAGLSLTNVQLSQAGAYSVTVSNLYGAATSAPAVLTVTGVPPVIVTSPASLAVAGGATVDFQVAATGSPPLVYQWVFNGTTAIAGATSSVLSLANVQLNQAGAYSATVSNLYGAATSAPALLQVFPPGIVVTNSEANLRAAMAAGGTVTFACDGTITLANTITNDVNVTLDGSGHQVTISGNGAVRMFCVNTNIHFTVVNLTIANGTSLGGSAILNLGGTVNLTGVSLHTNTATYYAYAMNDDLSPRAGGGAIFNRGGSVNATNCSFAGNVAQSIAGPPPPWVPLVNGGAIRNEAGRVTLRSCAFVGNQATGGSQFYSTSYGDPAFGGAIHNSGTVSLDLCTLAGNSASGGTAASWPFYSSFTGSEGSGGAIFNQGTLTVNRTALCGNTATGGSGGVGGQNSSTLNGYPGGYGAAANGGAICNLGSLWVTGSTFASNVVTGGAGGPGGAGVTIADIGGNGGSGGTGSSGLGGAVFNSGAASLVNCTIAFNAGSGGSGGNGGGGAGYRGLVGNGGAGGNGGSGFGGVAGTCNLLNCTVASNRGNAGSGGAGGGAVAGTPGAPGTSGAACGGTICGPMPNTLIAWNMPPGGDTFPDPKLGPLANNGGPTMTMAVLPGSPAIDAGNTALAPATDQRGYPRPAGLAADIGAFEFSPPVIAEPLPSQTAETGATADLRAYISCPAPLYYQWFFNGNALAGCTNRDLLLSGAQPSNVGAYTFVVRDVDGAVTSAPAMLNVIAPVERRPVPGVKLSGQTASLLNVDYANALNPAPIWTTLDSVTLTNTSQFYFDLSTPLPPQRFYRAWQSGTPGVVPSLSLPGMVPAITLTGNVADRLRLDYINRFGPTDAWVTLDTVTLTNTSQLYFDVSAPGQPARLYRIVPAP